MCLLALWSAHQVGFADPVAAPGTSPTQLDAQIDFILDHPLPESEYSRSNSCVTTNNYESVEVLGTRHLLFRGRRGALDRKSVV